MAKTESSALSENATLRSIIADRDRALERMKVELAEANEKLARNRRAEMNGLASHF